MAKGSIVAVAALAVIGLTQGISKPVVTPKAVPSATVVQEGRTIHERLVDHSVTVVSTGKDNKRALGSGVLFVNNGVLYCLTAAHVVGDGKGIYIACHQNIDTGATTVWRGFVCIMDPESDWAIMSLMRANESITGMCPAEFSTAPIRIGQQVIAVGSPAGENNTVTEGIVANNRRGVEWTEDPHFVITCDGAGGSSGCGVFDAKTGKCIGIVVRRSVSSGMLYCLPIDTIVKDIQALGQPQLLPPT